MERRPGRPRALTVDAIARAALDEGIGVFSMPSVARRLGVVHSGLYRYVADRDDLLLAALDLAVREAEWPAADQEWDTLLRALSGSVQQLCARHPGLDHAALTLTRRPPVVESLVEGYVDALRRQGFAPRDALAAVELVIGLALTASSGSRRQGPVDQDPALQFVLDGLATHRSAAGRH